MSSESDLDVDPWINAVHNGILRGVQVAIDNECWRAAIILVYAGIDAMACTTLPPGRVEVERSDFIKWADRYMRFPGPDQVRGIDLYAARCAMLHTYGVDSDLYRKGKAARVAYFVGGAALPVRRSPQYPDHVAVEIQTLAETFIRAVQAYGHEAQQNQTTWAIVEARIREFVFELPA